MAARKTSKKKKSGSKSSSAKKKSTSKKSTSKKSTKTEKPRSHTRKHSRYSVNFLAFFVARDPEGNPVAEGSGVVSNLSMGGAQIMQPEFKGGIYFPCKDFQIDFQEGPLAGHTYKGELISARDFSGKAAFGVRFRGKMKKKNKEKLENLLVNLDKNGS